MNKSELIEAIAIQTGSTKANAGHALDATLAAITASLASGEDMFNSKGCDGGWCGT